MRVLRTMMPRKARNPVSYKLKRACGAIKSFYSFLIEFSIIYHLCKGAFIGALFVRFGEF